MNADDEMESSGASWSDIGIPCHVLMKERDVEDVTNNPPFQAQVLNSTLNKDFLFIKDQGMAQWINASHYDLIEIITPPEQPTEKEHESIV